MNIKTEFSDKTLTAIIEGDIDHHTAKGIRETIDLAVEEKNPSALTLDFGNVQFMDSSGIGLIMGRYRLMKLLNGNLELVNLPEHINRLISLSGLFSLDIIKNKGCEQIETRE
ncbi:MAG: Anti-sigma F factor antagonist [Eubacteriales bacterium SKADARSKE-1]|nr:Anti-sigma F factor antagonist [Eubacteriales bacterium SKADARSKE-1]